MARGHTKKGSRLETLEEAWSTYHRPKSANPFWQLPAAWYQTIIISHRTAKMWVTLPTKLNSMSIFTNQKVPHYKNLESL